MKRIQFQGWGKTSSTKQKRVGKSDEDFVAERGQKRMEEQGTISRNRGQHKQHKSPRAMETRRAAINNMI